MIYAVGDPPVGLYNASNLVTLHLLRLVAVRLSLRSNLPAVTGLSSTYGSHSTA